MIKILFSFFLIMASQMSFAMMPNHDEELSIQDDSTSIDFEQQSHEDLTPEGQVFSAIRSCNLALVKELLEGSMLINIHDSEECTPLHCAAQYDRLAICEFLLHAGADVNAKDRSEKTPLMLAAEASYTQEPLYNYHGIAALLLNRGTQINAKDKQDKTALHYATQACNAQMCVLLIEHGADITLQDEMGKTPLIYAGIYAGARAIIREHSSINRDARKKVAIAMIECLHKRNQAIITMLLCLQRLHQKDENQRIKSCASEFYRQRKTLLFPYTGKLVSLKKLLDMEDNGGSLLYSSFPNTPLFNSAFVYTTLNEIENEKAMEKHKSLNKKDGTLCLIQ